MEQIFMDIFLSLFVKIFIIFCKYRLIICKDALSGSTGHLLLQFFAYSAIGLLSLFLESCCSAYSLVMRHSFVSPEGISNILSIIMDSTIDLRPRAPN